LEFFNYKTSNPPVKGSLLISEPYLPDPNFERTVVLLCEHNEEGSFGFVLNKPSNLIFSDVIDAVGHFEEEIFIGGPVQHDTLHFLHRSVEFGGAEVVNGIYWGGDFEKLMKMIQSREIMPEDFKFFIGYSGWSAGQLEEELEANSWIVANNPSASMVFDTPYSELWKVGLKQLGGRFGLISNYPIDPRLN
jgi:putative transcriptional regulator